ncbi:hypothetical protein FOL01_0445 [Weissella jogaejeotgali]|uniref:Protein NO VEIN C-terminal domain-containing protein n=1 Tax=Weissella jogaejeotgali TaxID=1631871 RepID=A0A1L6R9U4_9LACO|nr:DUF3883 domain-containing protein [Weissella jogaejeotgali]APS41304.1 hypothetical protein FOL01_0445 [Weissella jogaejeotgali]
MATSEEEIKKGVSLLLEQYGQLTTAEVKQKLDTVMNFDDEDMEPSGSRNEPLITQRIGNIVSHQKKQVETYYNVYQVDKSGSNAVWSILTGLNSQSTLRPISHDELKKRRTKREQFTPRKIDWTSLNDSRDLLGQAGEEYAMRYETGRVSKFAMNDLDRIIHLSILQGDGAGFDILSLNDDGSSRYIEVKTTRNNLDTPFYMTENERSFFDIHQQDDNLFIYRIYNFDKDTNSGEIEVISAKELFERFDFDATTYRVSRKI